MPDYLLLMHTDTMAPESDALWDAYFAKLSATGGFAGGSAIGGGISLRKNGTPAPLSAQLNGYIKVTADSLDAAQALVIGNPVYECGGTVEVRELPAD